MTTYTALSLLLPVAAVLPLAGCATSPPPLPPPPSGVQEIAVQLPANRTGAALVVDDPGFIGRYFGEKRSTVPDVLAGDLRSLLRDRGFRVLAGGAEDVLTLRTEIRRWDPYSADYSQITVSLLATLVDPASGRSLWTADRTDWKVQTPDARSGPEASGMAARDIARSLIEGWQPSGSRPAPAR
jgi:hypothetical protein